MLVFAALIALTLDFQKTLLFLIASLIMPLILGKIPIRLYFKTLLLAVPLLAGFITLHILVRCGIGVPLITIGPLIITREGLLIGLVYGMRILIVLNTSIAFALTTEPRDFIDNLQHYLKVPPVFTYSLYAALLMFHHLINILRESFQALSARYVIRGFIDYFKNIATLTTIILATTSKLIDNVAISMESRGFMAYPERTVRRKSRIGISDVVFAVSTLTIGLAIIFY